MPNFAQKYIGLLYKLQQSAQYSAKCEMFFLLQQIQGYNINRKSIRKQFGFIGMSGMACRTPVVNQFVCRYKDKVVI